MADTIMRGFLVSLGVDFDEAASKKATAAHAATEKKITKTHEAEVAKRDKIDTQEDQKREKAAQDAEKRDRERRQRATKESEGVLHKIQTAALGIESAMAAASAATAGMVYVVDRVAQKFEQLGYAAKRSGSSVTGLSAMGYAFSQTGSTVEAGQAFLERFGQKLQRYPGYKNALQRLLGKRIMDEHGGLTESTEDLAADLGDRLRQIRASGPLGAANAYAQGHVFGADDMDVNSLMDPRLRGFQRDKRAQLAQAGANPDQTAADSAAFEVSMRKFKGTVDSIGTAIEGDVTTKLRPELDTFTKFLQDHDQQITSFVTTLTDNLVVLETALTTNKDLKALLTSVKDGFDTLDRNIGTDDFKKTIATTAQELHVLAEALHWLMVKFGLIQNAQSEQQKFWQGNGSTDVSPGEAAGGGYGVSFGASGGRGLSGPDANRPSSVPKGFVGTTDKNLPTEGKALLDTLASGEAPGGYNILNGGGVFSDFKHGPPGGAHQAFGHYQFLPSTWRNVAQQLGTDPNDISPAAQDRAAWYLAQRDYKARTGHDLATVLKSGDAGAIAEAGRKLSPTWVSLNSGFLSKYRHFLSTNAPADAVAPSVPPMRATGGSHWMPRLPPRATPALTGASGDAGSPFGALDPNAFKTPPLGITPSVQSSIDNSVSNSKGDTNLTHAPVYNLTTTGTPEDALRVARMNAGRGWADVARNMRGMEQ